MNADSLQTIALVMDGAPVPLVLNRIDSGQILYCNASYAALVGIPHAKAAGRSVAEFYRSPEERQALVRQLHDGEALTNYEVGMKTEDGTPFEASLWIRPVALNGEAVVLTGVHDISERKRTEERLRARERTLHTVLDTIPYWLYVKDVEGRYLMVNQVMADCYGLEKAAFIGKEAMDLLPTAPTPVGTREELARLAAMDAQVLRDGEVSETPSMTHTLADGTVRIHRVLKRPLLNEEREIVGLVGLSEDITDRQQSMADLERNRRLLQTVIDTAPMSIFAKDLDANYLALNTTYAAWMGGTVDEFLGKSVLSTEFGTQEQQAQILEMDRQVLQRGQPMAFEDHRITGVDGAVGTYRVYKAPLLDEHGKAAGIVGIAEDVTAQKRAEAELKTKEERFRALIEGSLQGVFIHQAHRPLFVNQAFADMLGYRSPEAFLEEVALIADVVHPQERAKVSEISRRRDRGEEVPTVYETRFLHRDGSTVWVELFVRMMDWEGVRTNQTTCIDITERKRAEAALRASEDRFRDFAESAADWLWEMDAELRFTYFSPNVQRVLGVKPEWHYGKTRRDLLGEDYDRELWDDHLRTLEERRPFRDFIYLRSGEGVEPRWLSTSGQPIFAEDGTFQGYRGTGSDVTHRIQTEQALRENQHLLLTVLDTIPQHVAVKSADGTYLVVNRAMAAFYGRKKSDFLGKSPTTYQGVDSATAEEIERTDAHVFKTGEPFETWDWRVNAPDGTENIFHLRKLPLRIEETGVNALVIVSENMTEAVQSQRELRESQRLLNTIIDTLPHWISVKNRDGHFRIVNAPLLRAFDADAAQFVGRRSEEVLPVDPEAQDVLRRGNKAVLETGAPYTVPELRLRLPDGSEQLRHVESFPLAGDEGAIEGVVTWSEDITERRRAEDDLRQAQKMEAVGQLTGGIAHDFNNLLQVIQGYSHILATKLPAEFNGTRDLQRILAASERASNLTQQLLAFSRQQVYQPKPLDLNTLVGDLIKLIGRVIREDIEVVVRLSDQPQPMRADAGMMEQVIVNLCINARDAMPHGGHLVLETNEVAVDAVYRQTHPWAVADAYVVLSISDSGTGMPREVRDRIFEPFFTTKEAGKGTGLGLAMVYGIVQQHEGHISVYSEPGHGTEFKLFLPKVGTTDDSATRKAAPPAQGGTETILVAEDEEAVRLLVTDLLEAMGYTVLQASNGEEALEILEEELHRVSLVLLDVVMPKLGGKEAHNRIMAMQPDLPVVFSSGYAANILDAEYLQEHGIRIIHKPYAPADLYRVLREVLDA